jgi:alkaline phosphatase D
LNYICIQLKPFCSEDFDKITNFLLPILLISCAAPKRVTHNSETDFTLAFGSCNQQYKANILWKEIQKNKPDVLVWGGDNIYADTYNMDTLRKNYQTLKNQKGYTALVQNISVMTTWDDHEYGVNDVAAEFSEKEGSQEIFLDFFNVDKKSPRRNQECIYHSEIFRTPKSNVKVLVLDRRYFRTTLSKSKTNKRRFVPNTCGKGILLVETQWKWFTNELNNSTADFNIIVSSI